LQRESDLDDLLWSVDQIAAFIKRKPRQTYYLIHTKQIPAKKIGAAWVACRSKLRARLLGEEEAA
jgi:hypothetical protein